MKIEWSERVGIRWWYKSDCAFELSLFTPKGANWKQRLFGFPYVIKNGNLLRGEYYEK